MSQSDDNLQPPNSSEQNQGGGPRDSRLQTFLRQASAIIAAEKGLNNAAKAKLDDLAGRLHLPDELFEAGLLQLQDSNSPIGDLTDYEQAFLDFLVREFSQKPKGTVLSISIEEKAIKHAEDRFGISAHRAEQLFDYQAQESGIGRLSRTDAKDFGQQMILDLIGDQTTIDEKVSKRIFKIGKRWGWAREDVENLVKDRIADNEKVVRQQRRRPLILGLASLACIALIGLASYWLFENRESIFGKPKPKNDPVSVARTSEPVPDEGVSRTKLELAFPEFADSLSSEDSTTRIAAIEDVVDRMLTEETANDEQIQAVASWYYQETDSKVAGRFVQSLGAAMAVEPKSNRNGALESPYRAASLACAVLQSASEYEAENSKQRADSLHRVVSSRLDGAVEVADVDAEQVATSIAASQWNQLIQNSWQSPGRSSILIEALTTITKPYLTEGELQQFARRSVRTILLADRSQWQNMKSAIATAIESADEVQRIEWIELWLDDFGGGTGFREFAGPLLIDGSDRTTDSVVRVDESVLRAEVADWRNRRLRPALLRHQKIDETIDRLRPRFATVAESNATPDLIFQAASLANLCLEAKSITESGRAGDESAWSDVDLRLERLDSRLRDFVFLDAKESRPRVSSAGFDTTMRDRTIAAFGDLSEGNQAKRLAAIERLPGLVAKFESIPQPMASSLAKYLLSPIEPDEWLQAQRVVPEIANWHEVVLALADQLPESSASIDQVLTMYSVLTDGPWEEVVGETWKEDMSLSLLKLARDSLLADEAVDPDSSDSDWIRLEKFLQTAYYRRLSLLDPEAPGTNRSVIGNARQCVRAVAANSESVDRAIRLIEESTDNEIEEIVLLNQLLARSSNAKTPGGQSVGLQLFASELRLLQHWNQDRLLQLNGVIDEN
ncbi:hypothetical protein [Mariniblastus fucicola]|uniref:Uncharacterized protein n=1 Tax=Mariniblastus fucicola TaxID=980251 RepID=A0A5B9P2D7_9BACT|nr:hypothetical protein [Mariniblastus fucicola]QEG20364.1 hypothetical protein MFFC18_02110 [Mariniblastus fucicola]